MNKTKVALASLVIAGMILGMLPSNVLAAVTIPTRLSGSTAAQTAVAIAEQEGWTGTAILASSASFGASDALTAGPLASFLKAPILLQEPGAVLNPDTKAELIKLNVTKVYVTSGTAVISQAVLNQLTGMGINVESLGGVDRFETSVNIAKKLVSLGAPVKKVAVAYGWVNQDALSIAPIASYANEPIILTQKAGLSDSAQAFLAANPDIVTADVVGGTSVIYASVLAQLPSPSRYAGVTAYDTNNQVIQKLASSINFGNVYIANGVTGIDALAGAPLAAQTQSAIVLTNGTVPAAAAFVNSKLTADSIVTSLGGSAVVTEAVLQGFAYNAPAVLAVSSVNALNSKQLQIKFNKEVDKETLIAKGGNNNQGYDTLPEGLLTITRVTPDLNKTIIGDNMLASLSSDGMTLTLTASLTDNDIHYMDGTYTIYIANGVATPEGQSLGTYSTTIVVNDTAAPVVTSAAYNPATGNIDVVYNEPLKYQPIIRVNDGSPVPLTTADSGSRTTFSFDARGYDKGSTVNVKASGAADYSGNVQLSTVSQNVSITMDETPLTVTSLTQDASNTFKIVFNKTLAGDALDSAADVRANLTVYSNGKTVNSSDINVTRDTDNDPTNRTFIVAFNNSDAPAYHIIYPSSSDTVTLQVKIMEGGLTDVFGNTNAEIDTTVKMTRVTTGPSLVYSILGPNSQSFYLRFDTAIYEGDDFDGIQVRENGVDQTSDFTTPVISGKILTISSFPSLNVANGTYTIYLPSKSLTDINENTSIGISIPITVTDSTNSAVTVNNVRNGNGDNSFVVTYSGKVGDSAIIASNYTLDGVTMPSGTDLYFTDPSKDVVVISLPDHSVNYSSVTSSLINVNVFDDNGNKVAPVSSDLSTVTVSDNVNPSLVSASLSGNMLTLTFDEKIAASGISTTGNLMNFLSITGGSQFLTDGGSVATAVDGNKVSFVITTGSSNWDTIKANSMITVKTLANANQKFLLDLNGNVPQDGITKVVSKSVS
jgi:Putative cell wall-binding domain